MRRSLMAVILMALVLGACGGDDADPASTLEGMTTAVGQPPTTAAFTTTTVPSADREAVLGEYINMRNTGRMLASMDLATEEVADLYWERLGGLQAWNFRSEQAGPCVESAFAGRYRCQMLESTDFHTVGGLSPWVDQMTVTIDEQGVITYISHSIVDFETGVGRYNKAFQSWLTETHPDAAAEMDGGVMTRSFTAEDAVIALQYVEEFVAQSDSYPIDPTASG